MPKIRYKLIPATTLPPPALSACSSAPPSAWGCGLSVPPWHSQSPSCEATWFPHAPALSGQSLTGVDPDKPVHKLSQQDIESVQTVASYLSDHCAFDIPLERLTQIACMGTTKLKSCFKKYYDCTITEYIQQRRMSQAEYLLAYTELTVGQVAQTVGCSTSSRFAELFRKSMGLLPLEYRKTAQRK